MTNIIEIRLKSLKDCNIYSLSSPGKWSPSPFWHSELMERRVRVNDPRFKGPCGIDNCPATNYFKVDGRYVCERGHEQVSTSQVKFGWYHSQNIVETGEDEEAPAPSGVMRHTFVEEGGEAEERRRKREENLKRIPFLSQPLG